MMTKTREVENAAGIEIVVMCHRKFVLESVLFKRLKSERREKGKLRKLAKEKNKRKRNAMNNSSKNLKEKNIHSIGMEMLL